MIVSIVSRSLNDRPHMSTLAERAIARTPRRLVLRFGGMSDRAIAWLFITPSVLLLLAINIFPLLWTIQLSFTNYRANRPNAALRYVGLDNYRDILTDPEVWHAMQATAHFVLWSITTTWAPVQSRSTQHEMRGRLHRVPHFGIGEDVAILSRPT